MIHTCLWILWYIKAWHPYFVTSSVLYYHSPVVKDAENWRQNTITRLVNHTRPDFLGPSLNEIFLLESRLCWLVSIFLLGLHLLLNTWDFSLTWEGLWIILIFWLQEYFKGQNIKMPNTNEVKMNISYSFNWVFIFKRCAFYVSSLPYWWNKNCLFSLIYEILKQTTNKQEWSWWKYPKIVNKRAI